MSTPRLWLVRHAQPLVAPGVCYGQLNVAANATATHAAGLALAQALPPCIAAVRYSPLQRCAQLAQALQALRPSPPPMPDADLVELDFGTWEGRPWSRIARADLDCWAADFCAHAPGGGESLAHMLQRVAQALRTARALAAAGQGDIVWLTHAGVARCAQWLLAHGTKRLPLAHEWPHEAPVFGAWAVLPLRHEAHPG